jgi:hypothetical protein
MIDMRRILIGLLLPVTIWNNTQAQCKTANEKEQTLFHQTVGLIDKELKAKCEAAGWSGGLKNDGKEAYVTESRPMPERPLAFCGTDQFTLSLSLPPSVGRGSLFVDIAGMINAPLLTLSSIHGDGQAKSVKKITIPGVTVAYLITTDEGDLPENYKVVLGLGK